MASLKFSAATLFSAFGISWGTGRDRKRASKTGCYFKSHSCVEVLE